MPKGVFFGREHTERGDQIMIFKRYIWCFVVVFLFWVITPAYGMNVTLQWDANTEPNLAGYKVYYDTDSGAPYNPAVEDRATNNPDGPPIVLGSDATEITLAGRSIPPRHRRGELGRFHENAWHLERCSEPLDRTSVRCPHNGPLQKSSLASSNPLMRRFNKSKGL